MAAAVRTSWKTLPPPKHRAKLTIASVFSHTEGERMRSGFVPRNMDDRWFVYFEEGWLNFHRSWTGSHVFAVRLDSSRPSANLNSHPRGRSALLSSRAASTGRLSTFA